MRLSDTTAIAVLFVAVLLAYFNALGAAFQFDDLNVIVDNPAVHSISAWADSMPGIRPLLKYSYALNWTLGESPFGFHLLNVVVHAVNALLVFRLSQRLVAASAIGKQQPDGAWAPLVCALVFALHPVQTEAVTYVSGRSVSLMSFFYLCSVLAWLRAAGTDEGSWRLGSAALFGAALLVKETAVTLPLALLLVDVCVAHEARGWRDRLLRLRWHILVLVFALAVMLASSTYRRMIETSLTARGVADNLLTQADAIWYLVAQTILPWRMNADPDLPVFAAMSLPLLLEIAVLAAIVYAGLRGMRRRSCIAFAALWFLLHLLPTNSLLPRLDVANDRQLYLAIIGPSFALGLGVDAFLRWSRRLVIAAAFACVVVLVLGVATFQRNQAYLSPIAFWEDTLAKSPRKARVANNLGYAYQQAGRLAEAKLAYQQAIVADPDYWRARINLEALESLPASR